MSEQVDYDLAEMTGARLRALVEGGTFAALRQIWQLQAKAVADDVGVSQPSISRYEAGISGQIASWRIRAYLERVMFPVVDVRPLSPPVRIERPLCSNKDEGVSYWNRLILEVAYYVIEELPWNPAYREFPHLRSTISRNSIMDAVLWQWPVGLHNKLDERDLTAELAVMAERCREWAAQPLRYTADPASPCAPTP